MRRPRRSACNPGDRSSGEPDRQALPGQDRLEYQRHAARRVPLQRDQGKPAGADRQLDVGQRRTATGISRTATSRRYLGQLFSDWSDIFSTEARCAVRATTRRRAVRWLAATSRAVQVNVTSDRLHAESKRCGTEFSSQVNAIDIKSSTATSPARGTLAITRSRPASTATKTRSTTPSSRRAVGSYTFQGLTQTFSELREGLGGIHAQAAGAGLTLAQSQANFKKQQYGAIPAGYLAGDRSFLADLRSALSTCRNSRTSRDLQSMLRRGAGRGVHCTGVNGKVPCAAPTHVIRSTKGGFGLRQQLDAERQRFDRSRASRSTTTSTPSTRPSCAVASASSCPTCPTVWYSNSFGGNRVRTIVTYDIVDNSRRPDRHAPVQHERQELQQGQRQLRARPVRFPT